MLFKACLNRLPIIEHILPDSFFFLYVYAIHIHTTRKIEYEKVIIISIIISINKKNKIGKSIDFYELTIIFRSDFDILNDAIFVHYLFTCDIYKQVASSRNNISATFREV